MYYKSKRNNMFSSNIIIITNCLCTRYSVGFCFLVATIGFMNQCCCDGFTFQHERQSFVVQRQRQQHVEMRMRIRPSQRFMTIISASSSSSSSSSTTQENNLSNNTTVPSATTTMTSNFTTRNNDNDNDNININKNKDDDDDDVFIPLQPFLPAADPQYACTGEIGNGTFIIQRTGSPTVHELTNENILKIVKLECTDLEVNTLVWKCLGYRFDEADDGDGDDAHCWKNDHVYPNFQTKYPKPPDFINMQRIYEKNIDEPSLRANQALVRSIPLEYKQCLKPALKSLGWTGYKMKGLTPNKTRRAQCANWLIYYRDHLYGYTVEELRERRRLRKIKEEEERRRRQKEMGENDVDDFRPPVNEVY